MNILLTGATGYIGKRMLPILVGEGHTVYCCVRDKERFTYPESIRRNVKVIEVDFLKKESQNLIPKEIEAAYYLIHSMSSNDDFVTLEKQSALNFKSALCDTSVKQVIYLSGIVNVEDDELSRHLSSRKAVENYLQSTQYALTTLRAGIIIGSGSASFEILRDLVEKLPVLIAPKWVMTKCQPIAIRDVLTFLTKSLANAETYNETFDIAGPDILSYKEMLLGFAKKRKLKRWLISVPVMTPRLSSYWLYFVTSTSYPLAVALVNSMKVEVVASDSRINKLLNVEPMSYSEALDLAFARIEQNTIVSSWKDSFVSSRFDFDISEFIDVPTYGCFVDKRQRNVKDKSTTIQKIWAIGGSTGWYYGNYLWRIRGFLDKLVGGVGLRRGRTNINKINVGDAVDFWRVLYADQSEGRLLLYAEMKLPGDAWLEFRLVKGQLIQTATFRPKGVLGRLYWYSVLPFHGLIFNGMLKALTEID